MTCEIAITDQTSERAFCITWTDFKHNSVLHRQFTHHQRSHWHEEPKSTECWQYEWSKYPANVWLTTIFLEHACNSAARAFSLVLLMVNSRYGTHRPFRQYTLISIAVSWLCRQHSMIFLVQKIFRTGNVERWQCSTSWNVWYKVIYMSTSEFPN